MFSLIKINKNPLPRSVYVYPGLPARQTTPDAVVPRALRSLGEAWECFYPDPELYAKEKGRNVREIVD